MKKITRAHLTEWLSTYATEERILDIGSGTIESDPLFPNRMTVDISEKGHPDLIADVHALPIADASYGMILCREVLEHCVDPAAAVREMMRVLQPGGTLVLTTRFVFPLHDAPADFWRFTPYGLRRLFSEWSILDLREETRPFSCIAVLLQRIELQTTLRFNKPMKFFLRGIVWMFNRMDGLVVSSYGDNRKDRKEPIIMSSGLYIAVRKTPAA